MPAFHKLKCRSSGNYFRFCESLKEGGKFGTSAGMQRIRGLLVVTEIALAVVLLAGAGLMLRSFMRLQNMSPGFTAEGVLHLEINPTYRRQEDYRVEFMSRRYQQLLQQVAAVPGVVAVAANSDFAFCRSKALVSPTDRLHLEQSRFV